MKKKTSTVLVVTEIISNEKYGVPPVEKEVEVCSSFQQAIGVVADKAQDYIANVIGDKRYMWDFDEVGDWCWSATNKDNGHHIEYKVSEAE